MEQHIDTQAGNVKVKVITEGGNIRPHHACLLQVSSQAAFALTRKEALEVVTMLVNALHERQYE